MSGLERLPTQRQMDVLGVVGSVGTVTATEVGEYHLPIGGSSARSALAALERRGLVSAVYTGYGKRGRAYAITHEGDAALTDEERCDVILRIVGGWDIETTAGCILPADHDGDHEPGDPA